MHQYYHPLRLSILPKLTYFISEVPFSYGSVSFYHRFFAFALRLQCLWMHFRVAPVRWEIRLPIVVAARHGLVRVVVRSRSPMTSRVVQSTEQICANLPATV